MFITIVNITSSHKNSSGVVEGVISFLYQYYHQIHYISLSLLMMMMMMMMMMMTMTMTMTMMMMMMLMMTMTMTMMMMMMMVMMMMVMMMMMMMVMMMMMMVVMMMTMMMMMPVTDCVLSFSPGLGSAAAASDTFSSLLVSPSVDASGAWKSHEDLPVLG